MGLIISRFKSKTTSKDKLEKIDDEIKLLEEYKFIAIKQQKNIIGLLFFVSGLIYIISLIVFYFWYFPKSSTWQRKTFFAVSLIIFPLLVYLLKRLLQWYYRWVIDSKEDKLKNLRREKRKILDKVMETETYKVAKELLEKYEPSALKHNSSPPGSNTALPSQSNLTFRGSHLKSNISFTSTPRQAQTPFNRSAITLRNFHSSQYIPVADSANIQRPLPRPISRLSRPILSQDRTVLEKLVDYVVGDGPNNRYALICKYCNSHNGMALKEEFEYLSFRCCYCSSFNPARKERKFAPSIMASMELSTENEERVRSASPIIDEPESDTENKENESQKNLDLPTITEIKDTKEKVQEDKEKNNDKNQETLQDESSSMSEKHETEEVCDNEEKQVLL